MKPLPTITLCLGLLTYPAMAQDLQSYKAEVIKVIDGDTFDAKVRLFPSSRGAMETVERIRLRNVGTPETKHRAKCDRERELGDKATAFTASFLNGPITLTVDWNRPRGNFGRVLATVSVDGMDLGEALISAGLAKKWQGGRADWCE